MGYAIVSGSERVEDEGSKALNVVADIGGGETATVEHCSGSGEDAPPLPGDLVATGDAPGAGRLHSAGYIDPKNEGKAAPGERRTYARNPAGEVVAEIWAKGDGSIRIASLVGKTVEIEGVIFQGGTIKAPGEITAMAETAPVKLSTHLHPTAMGPSGKPTPGT